MSIPATSAAAIPTDFGPVDNSVASINPNSTGVFDYFATEQSMMDADDLIQSQLDNGGTFSFDFKGETYTLSKSGNRYVAHDSTGRMVDGMVQINTQLTVDGYVEVSGIRTAEGGAIYLGNNPNSEDGSIQLVEHSVHLDQTSIDKSEHLGTLLTNGIVHNIFQAGARPPETVAPVERERLPDGSMFVFLKDLPEGIVTLANGIATTDRGETYNTPISAIPEGTYRITDMPDGSIKVERQNTQSSEWEAVENTLGQMMVEPLAESEGSAPAQSPASDSSQSGAASQGGAPAAGSGSLDALKNNEAQTPAA